MANYRKFFVAVAGLATAIGVVLADGAVDGAEWGVLASAVGVAIGVFLAENTPPAEPSTVEVTETEPAAVVP